MNRVYIIDVSKLEKEFPYEELYEKASSYRKEKVDKLVFKKDKILSLCVDYLLRYALNEIGIEYNNIEIDFEKNNKPILKNIEGVYFNLSHSKEIAICAISNNEIGCDVQKKIGNNLEIANRFFCKEEIDLINKSKTVKQKEDMFYRLWTLKESYMKALGLGLNIGLSQFQIQFDKDKISVLTQNGLDTDFYFEEIKLKNKDYKCAICSKCFEKCEIKEIKGMNK